MPFRQRLQDASRIKTIRALLLNQKRHYVANNIGIAEQTRMAETPTSKKRILFAAKVLRRRS